MSILDIPLAVSKINVMPEHVTWSSACRAFCPPLYPLKQGQFNSQANGLISCSHREWRERRDMALKHRAQVAEEKKSKTVEAAQKAVDDFYENYNNKRDKTVAQTRREAEDFLANRENTSSGGTSWERIAKLVDLSGKGAKGGAAGTGKEKFRELLTSLRKDEKAPGATGV